MTRLVLAVVAGAAVLTWALAQAAATIISEILLAVVMRLALVGGVAAQAAAAGTVVAVTPEPGTLVIKSTLKADSAWLGGALRTDPTTFTGQGKGLQDVHPGDRVSPQPQRVREEDGDIARSVSLK